MFRLRDYYAPDFTDPMFASCPDAVLRPAETDTVAPDNYHAMSIYPEYFRISGQWLLAEESRMDRPAMYSYEPGSVFKIFTVGIAYDQHGISPNDSFLCDGVYEKKLSSGERIRIKCLEHHGWCTPRDALRFSCNDALGQIADRIYDDDFIARIRQLGFGAKTGVELPGETAGLVKDPESRSWSARSKPTIAIGQEITVSALQMVQAASAIANGGVPVQLTFIHKITSFL